MHVPTRPRSASRGKTAGRLTVALATGSVVLLAAGCGTEVTVGSSPTPTPTPSPTESATASPSPSESPSESSRESPEVETSEFGVYFIVDTRAGLSLAREVRDLPASDPAEAAVEAMLDGPDDPDYTSPWNPATEVIRVQRESDGIVVVLSEEARTADVGSEAAALMVQQLVYTVTEAMDPTDTVQLFIGEEAAGELWGSVTWDGPVDRDDPLAVRSFVQIDSPREGESLTSPVTVEGEAAAFEANVPWRVLDESGAEVETGFTTTSAGQTFAPYSFTVDLDPGTYTVEISEDDPSGGEGGTPMTDTRTITVE